MNRSFTILAISAVFVAGLGCAGLRDRAGDYIANNPEARKAFEESFREEFVASCAKGSPTGTEAQMEQLCGCTAEALLKDVPMRQLLKIASDPDDEDNAAVLERAMNGCLDR